MKNKKLGYTFKVVPSLVLVGLLCTATSKASSSKSIQPSTTTFSAVTFGHSPKDEVDVVYIGRLDFYESQENRSFLYHYNLKTGKNKKIDLPESLQARSFLSIFPQKESQSKIYVFSQIHKAGADFPRIDLYDFENDKWTVVAEEIDCVNFSELSVIKEKLTMKCGDDYLHPPKNPEFSVDLPDALAPVVVTSEYKIELLDGNKDINVKLLKSGKNFKLASKLK